MDIAILGGGFTGLTAAYYLNKKGHTVTLLEKNKILGGLAAGFKTDHWEWPLEYAYHHLFASDNDILNFAKEVQFTDIFFRTPKTDSLYLVNGNYRIFPVDTPQDFLRFPLLSFPDKIRAAAALAFLRYSPFLSIFEKYTAQQYIQNCMGNQVWEVFWKELFRKKFGIYAGNILLAWYWSRITKRTKQLGYIKGGFQTFVDYLEKINLSAGISIHKDYPIIEIRKEKEVFKIKGADHEVHEYDAVISTLPSPVLLKAGKQILPPEYLERLSQIKYLWAQVLIIETKEKILDETYWLNICTDQAPMMFIGQHTNFIDPQYYGGNNVAYIANYLDDDSPLLKMSKDELWNNMKTSIESITGKQVNPLQIYHFKAPFAQPIYEKSYLMNKPDFITPVERFYIANLDMTYPHDRGTNYAVKLGKEVAEKVR